MSGMWLPTMAGIARMAPIQVIIRRDNVAGTTTNDEYTVPSGRLGIVTMMAIQHVGGTAYSQLGFEVLPSGAAEAGPIFEAVSAGVTRVDRAEGWVWLTEGDALRSIVRGGDGTSDYRVHVSGVEFDWVLPDDNT